MKNYRNEIPPPHCGQCEGHPSANEAIYIGDIMHLLCARLGVDRSYVSSIYIQLGHAEVRLQDGSEGFCKGSKYVEKEPGHPRLGDLAETIHHISTTPYKR